MKFETIFVEGLQRNISFYIGKSKEDNFEVIDKGNPNDLWFHAKDYSSCHVVCILPDNKYDKKKLKYLIKVGALLCKHNTNKLKGLKNIEFSYTKIKNIIKTEIPGKVEILSSKTITC